LRFKKQTLKNKLKKTINMPNKNCVFKLKILILYQVILFLEILKNAKNIKSFFGAYFIV